MLCTPSYLFSTLTDTSRKPMKISFADEACSCILHFFIRFMRFRINLSRTVTIHQHNNRTTLLSSRRAFITSLLIQKGQPPTVMVAPYLFRDVFILSYYLSSIKNKHSKTSIYISLFNNFTDI